MGKTVGFELYLGAKFNELELSMITQTLHIAQEICSDFNVSWRFSAQDPGFVTGATGLMVRAEPAIADHGFADILVVIGHPQTASDKTNAWIVRVRAMQRLGRPVVLLSDAATAYIRASKPTRGAITTHWKDLEVLSETGYYPTLTSRQSEEAGGIITAAGSGATAELILGLIAPFIASTDVAQIANHLLLNGLRKSTAEQPARLSDNPSLFDARITKAIRLMEDTLSEPLPITQITRKIGVSSRHLERVFREVFNDSPAHFYKRLRVKQARRLIEETQLPLIEVAVATGFRSTSTLSVAVRAEYGRTPHQMRVRKSVKLLDH